MNIYLQALNEKEFKLLLDNKKKDIQEALDYASYIGAKELRSYIRFLLSGKMVGGTDRRHNETDRSEGDTSLEPGELLDSLNIEKREKGIGWNITFKGTSGARSNKIKKIIGIMRNGTFKSSWVIKPKNSKLVRWYDEMGDGANQEGYNFARAVTHPGFTKDMDFITKALEDRRNYIRLKIESDLKNKLYKKA